MAEGQEDLLQELIQAYQETLRILRSLQRGGRSILSQLSRAQQKRILIERGNEQLKWNENLRQATQDMSPAERSQLLERHADVALQNDALEQQRNDLQARTEELQQQNAAGEERLAEQQRDLDAASYDDQDHNDRSDLIDNRVDADGNNRDDNLDRDEATDDQNQAAEDLDNAVEDREADQARADEDRRKQDEQDRQRDEQRGDGIDPATVAETAAVAELANAELDQDRADDDLQQQDQQGLDENGERPDPANEADNTLETGTDDAERGQADPAVAAEAGLDADDRQHQDELGQTDPSQDQPGLGDQGQEPALDADNTLNEPGVDADNAVDDRSRDADNAVEADASQEGPSPYATDESDRDSAVDSADPALDSDVNRDDGQQTDIGADQDGVNPAVAADGRATDDLEQDQSDLGQDSQQVDPQDVDSQQAAPQVDGQQPVGQQASPQQVDAPGAEAPGAEGPQAEAPQAEAPQAEAPQVDAQGQAPEQGANQTPQVNGPNPQQIANASQTAVDEAGIDGDAQGTGAQTSDAKGSQWRPPEDPAIAEARAGQPNGQQSGPSQDLPPDEKAKLEDLRGDQKPLSSVNVDNAAVSAGARPGTPASQRTADRGRNDGRSNDNGGRGRGE